MQFTATGLVGILEYCAPSHSVVDILFSINDIAFLMVSILKIDVKQW